MRAVELVDVGGQRGDGRAGGAGGVEQALELHHGDEHAVALGAVEQRRLAERGLHERDVADGAGLVVGRGLRTRTPLVSRSGTTTLPQ
jgi:hypothetical protein